MQPFRASRTIVFIHGLFMNRVSWTEWMTYFQERGYTCHAPAYPYHEGSPANLRTQVDSRLGKVSFDDVVKSLVGFIDQLPEKPLLIGHSMGGLAVQKLMEQGQGVAGVCIDSAPPMGIFSLKWSFLKANVEVINPLQGNSIFHPTVTWFQYAFCNTMSVEETKEVVDRLVVPESRNIPRSSTGRAGKIDFRKPHGPLLFIAGEKDHIVPPSLNRKNAAAYKDKSSRVDFHEFPGRTHFICGQDGWHEVAGFVHHWLLDLK